MAIYRKHQGLLEESLSTAIKVYSLDDILFSWQYHRVMPHPTNLKCELYGYDNRFEEWKQTYIITADLCGKNVVLGFTNEMVK